MTTTQSPVRAIPRSLKFGLLAALAIAFAFGAFAVTRAQSSSDEITICVANDGNIRMANSNGECRPNETAQTLNRQGPAGPPGPEGPQGDPGTVTVNVNEGGDTYAGPAHIFLEDPANPDLGESAVEGFEGAVEILEWSWGIENTINIGSTSGGGGAGKANFKELHILKWMDKATPLLMQYVAQGTHIPELVLTGVTPAEDGSSVRYVITMEQVFVTSVELAADSGESLPGEVVMLEFAAVKVDYHSDDSDGSPSGPSPTSFSWDLQAGTP